MSTASAARRVPSRAVARRLALAAVLSAAAVVTYLVLFAPGGSYTIHARFVDAGQLVKGGAVDVAGRKVGTLSDISLAPNGQADIELSIDDGAVTPLHRGTRASIRALGQAGVANRYVDLAPGPETGPPLVDGSVLPSTQTSGIVNLDALLDSFGPRERTNLQQLIANSARLYAGSGARYFNRTLARLDPALVELDRVTGELAQDRAGLGQLIATAATATRAIASRRQDLRAAVAHTARSLEAIASQRRALGDLLGRAPGVLNQARGTLADTGTALTALRPALRDVPPVSPPLRQFVLKITSTLPAARPVVAQLRAQLPNLRRSLAGLQPLEPPTVAGLVSAGRALDKSRHVLRAGRIYGSDLILGVLAGLAGVATANHDRWGHYARLEFTQPPQSTLGGPLAGLLSQHPLIPGLFDLKTRQLRRCPGGNTPPAIDGSSPWIPDLSLCDPATDVPADVNQP